MPTNLGKYRKLQKKHVAKVRAEKKIRKEARQYAKQVEYDKLLAEKLRLATPSSS
jgi:anti-sigma regulatory factor (Ser/Thr protein kinase)